MTAPIKSGSPAVGPWGVPLLCMPCLLAFALFLVSFPIDRKIAFWPKLTIGELYLHWFLFVTPISTLIALILLIKRRVQANKFLAWLLVIVSVLANAFVILGFIG